MVNAVHFMLRLLEEVNDVPTPCHNQHPESVCTLGVPAFEDLVKNVNVDVAEDVL
jgi:hypothetical protein